jgi:NADH:ubiquinone oxidoreductase subunit E
MVKFGYKYYSYKESVMDKISVEVCIGTTCFVMGGNNLHELNEIIPKKYGKKVEVKGCNCLRLCSINWEYSKAPYVKVDDVVINEATVDKVLAEIDKKLGLKK